MNRNKDDIICHCQEVTYKTILQAIQNGATTVDEISEITDAGIACGYCLEEIEDILEEFIK
jgi:NAD(P)H-nitrite reductase large subunit